MDKQNYLSNLSQFEGLSLREIAKRSGHHFNTVKKYVDKEDWNEEYKPRKERASLIDPLKPIIDEWITEDLKRGRKYRRTGTKIYKDIRDDGELSKMLAVGKQTVINYVSRRKKELSKKTYKTAMFGLHSMGEAQVDFGKVLVVNKNGAEEAWHELVVSFPFSNAGFAQICRYETKECLCEGLQRIFEYIGGVPLRILFDNMSSAVVHIEEHGNRQLTEMFMRFTMHHRYKAEFCNPGCMGEQQTRFLRLRPALTVRTKKAMLRTKSGICGEIICCRRRRLKIWKRLTRSFWTDAWRIWSGNIT